MSSAGECWLIIVRDPAGDGSYLADLPDDLVSELEFSVGSDGAEIRVLLEPDATREQADHVRDLIVNRGAHSASVTRAHSVDGPEAV